MARTSARIALKATSKAKTTRKILKALAKAPAEAKKAAGSTNRGRLAKGKRGQREATKALNRKKAAKAARAKKGSYAGPPQPVKVYNDELKTSGLEWEVEAVVDSKKDPNGETLYLVKWVGFASSQNTWEPEVHLRNAMGLISEYDDANPSKP